MQKSANKKNQYPEEKNDILQNPHLLGESLKRLRTARDMTVQQTADATRLSKSFVSLVESGKRTISFEDVLRLVHALRMSLGWFVTQTRDSFRQSSLDAPLEAAMTSIIQPRSEGILFTGKRSNTAPRLMLMRPLRYEQDMQFLELFLPPTSQLTHEPITTLPASNSNIYEVRGVVQSGTLLIIFNNDEYRANTGDEFCFDGTVPHLYRNYTPEAITATLIITKGGL
jgi:transcriptional regulator with XRE-family HTH domain